MVSAAAVVNCQSTVDSLSFRSLSQVAASEARICLLPMWRPPEKRPASSRRESPAPRAQPSYEPVSPKNIVRLGKQELTSSLIQSGNKGIRPA